MPLNGIRDSEKKQSLDTCVREPLDAVYMGWLYRSAAFSG